MRDEHQLGGLGEGGMAAALNAQHWGRWREQGMRAMTVADGMNALEAILTTGATQAAVIPLDWATFRRGAGQHGVPRIWSALLQGTA